MPDEIFVDYEYGNLREVIVGLGVMRYPDIGRVSYAQEALKVLPDDEAAKWRARSGRHTRDLPKYELMEAENDELINVLEQFDVVVHRPDEITDELVAVNFGAEWLAHGYIQAYARDPIFVVGDNVIELTPGSAPRRADLLGYRCLFAERAARSGARWFQMPLVDVSAVTQPGYDKNRSARLEGGDLLVLGDLVLAGTTANKTVGSSRLGIEWLASVLGPQGFDVRTVPVTEQFLHLDVCLSIPRDGLAIACPEAFVNGLPDALDGWDIIEVTAQQAQLLACNGMPLDPDNYILPFTDYEDGSTVQAGLEAHGITVHRVAFGNHTEDGGAVRCATHPLVRRLKT